MRALGFREVMGKMLPDDLEPHPEHPVSLPSPSDPAAPNPPGDQQLIESARTAPTLNPAELQPDRSTLDKAEDLRGSLALLLERLSETADEVTIKLRDPSLAAKEKTRRKRLAEFAKDFGSLFTGIGSILTSLVIGAATVTLAIFTFRFNAQQAENTQKNLKTSALTEFSEMDPEKRTIAAIRLAVYGEEALPAIRLALGVSNTYIRSGAVQAAQVMYQSQPETRPKLLQQMTSGFADNNPYLRTGVVEFYSETADQLDAAEKQDFLTLIKNRIGPDAKGCSAEPDDLLIAYIIFLKKGQFPDSKELLLSLGRLCPAEKEGVRIHAVNMVKKISEGLAATDRVAIAKELESLKPVATDGLKQEIDNRIKELTSP